jgi:hypothetical protein
MEEILFALDGFLEGQKKEMEVLGWSCCGWGYELLGLGMAEVARDCRGGLCSTSSFSTSPSAIEM